MLSTLNHQLSTAARLVIAAAVAAIATGGTIAKFRPEIRRLGDLEDRASALAEEERRLAVKLADVERKHRWLRDEPAYVEAVARDRLDLRLPGETIFRITPADKPE